MKSEHREVNSFTVREEGDIIIYFDDCSHTYLDKDLCRAIFNLLSDIYEEEL